MASLHVLQGVVPLDHFTDTLVKYTYGIVPWYATKLGRGFAVVSLEHLSYDVIIRLYNTNIIAGKIVSLVYVYLL